MNAKPIYKIMDSKGRVLIPKEYRTAIGVDYGDIVRLGISQGTVSVKKVDLIEAGDQSPEAVEAFVRSAIKGMQDDIRLSLITDLTELIKQRREG